MESVISKIKKTKVLPFLAALVVCILFCGCSIEKYSDDDLNKVKIVTTIFPASDFAKNVAGDNAKITQLLKPGAESHTFEPTAQNMMEISTCDIFIYAGGESDTWIEDILEATDGKVKIISMLDCVKKLEEEQTEGMKGEGGALMEYLEEEEEEEEWDEHVWMSPVNAVKITEEITNVLCEVDSENSDVYKNNASVYISKLNELDATYRNTLFNVKNHTIVVADRFPFRYLTNEYNLDYYGAFLGCSEDAEVTATTLVSLCEKVKENNIDTVFVIEFSNEKIAKSICEVTGAKIGYLHSCHNLSNEEIKRGEDYISLMKKNLSELKDALD